VINVAKSKYRGVVFFHCYHKNFCSERLINFGFNNIYIERYSNLVGLYSALIYKFHADPDVNQGMM
jgi:hypothetical protein